MLPITIPCRTLMRAMALLTQSLTRLACPLLSALWVWLAEEAEAAAEAAMAAREKVCLPPLNAKTSSSTSPRVDVITQVGSGGVCLVEA